MKYPFMVILALVLVSTEHINAQIPYYDAIFLKTQRNAAGRIILTNEVQSALANYYPGKTSADMTAVFLADNLFFINLFRDKGADFVDNTSFSPAGLLSAVGNLDVTNIADGLAKFLVKRTKEELSVAFFSKFYELINKPEYKDARILFPQTYATLSAIGDEIYNYETYINSLRESFEKDLNGLLDNLPKVINDGRYSAFFAKHPDLKAACLSAIYIGAELIDKEHPGKIIADYDVSLLDKVNPDVKASVQTLQLFSESFRSKGNDHYWIDGDSLKLLTGDPVALQIYFGLIYQQAKTASIKFSVGDLTALLQNNLLPALGKINSYNAFIKGFIKQASIVTKSIDNIGSKDKDKLTFNDYYDLYTGSLDLIEYAAQVTELPGIKGAIAIPDKFQDYIHIARAGGDIAFDISRKNYSSAIMNAYSLYSFAFGGSDESLQKKVDDAGNAGDADASALLADRSTLPKAVTDAVKKFILKYGSFIAAVSQAQNSDDVEKAIEAAALPSGSSRVKRETSFNVSLNAYTGLFYGHEAISGLPNKSFFNSFGLTAPVGVSISRGHSVFFIGTGDKGWEKGQYGWSTSLFISLVDLGAIAAYRFKDDSTAQVPSIQLKNIFSPGAFLSIGIPKCPLSVNFGAQMGPNLRKINNNNTTQPSTDGDNKTYWRFSVSLCVDIPLLNFYTKSR